MRVEWDFDRLPPHEHDHVIELYQAGKWWDIIILHDAYELSDNNYCCSNTLQGVKKWIEHGIETGRIRPSASKEAEAQPKV